MFRDTTHHHSHSHHQAAAANAHPSVNRGSMWHLLMLPPDNSLQFVHLPMLPPDESPMDYLQTLQHNNTGSLFNELSKADHRGLRGPGSARPVLVRLRLSSGLRPGLHIINYDTRSSTCTCTRRCTRRVPRTRRGMRSARSLCTHRCSSTSRVQPTTCTVPSTQNP